jgi:hypothetical protein
MDPGFAARLSQRFYAWVRNKNGSKSTSLSSKTIKAPAILEVVPGFLTLLSMTAVTINFTVENYEIRILFFYVFMQLIFSRNVIDWHFGLFLATFSGGFKAVSTTV